MLALHIWVSASLLKAVSTASLFGVHLCCEHWRQLIVIKSSWLIVCILQRQWISFLSRLLIWAVPDTEWSTPLSSLVSICSICCCCCWQFAFESGLKQVSFPRKPTNICDKVGTLPLVLIWLSQAQVTHIYIRILTGSVVGPHRVSVEYGHRAVKHSPFLPIMSDSRLVILGSIHETTVGQQVWIDGEAIIVTAFPLMPRTSPRLLFALLMLWNIWISTVDTRKAGPGVITAEVRGPHTRPRPVITEATDQMWNIFFRTTEAGTHLVRVFFNNQEVPGEISCIFMCTSSFNFFVIHTSDNSKED